jgi:ATP-dependent Clp protease adapter protein ClpS
MRGKENCMGTMVVDSPDLIDEVKDSNGGGTCGGCQVVIYNDNVNSFDYVVKCLMNVFKHPEGVAHKITNEAHHKGRAIAEVEEAEKAQEHAQMMCMLGVKATVEKF